MITFASLRKRLCVSTPHALLLLAFGMAGPMAAAAGLQTDDAHPPIPDTLQQRIVACTNCHGAHGEGSPDSANPRLAGKPAGYLYQELRYFQDGQRAHAPMEHVVRQLSPRYMREIAEYFSRQDVPYQRSPVPQLAAPALHRGEQLVYHGDAARGLPSCASCHGNQLTGVEPLMPGLLGLSYDYISAQLVAWRAHTRAAKGPYCMAIVANRMRESDIAAVAAWLANHEPPADMHPEPASAQTEPLPGWCLMGSDGDGR